MSKATEEEIQEKKRQSTGQLLFKAARLWNELAIEKFRALGQQVKISHTMVLPHVSLTGTRLTEIAEKLGVTKQAAAQIVDELEEMGMLKRIPDPADGRAKLVTFTARGKKSMLSGMAVLGEIERELVGHVGTTEMNRLRDTLSSLVTALSATEE